MLNKTNVCILLSGGLDSMACIQFYKDHDANITALFCDYGQMAYKQELVAVKAVSKFYNIPFDIISCKGLPDLLKGEIVGRNALLLQLALYKMQKTTGIIAIGIHSGTQYIDCTINFINQMQRIFDLYTDGTVLIGTPFLYWTKTNIWNYCLKNNAPIWLTYSCQIGGKQPCGECDTCKDLEVLYASKESGNKAPFRR